MLILYIPEFVHYLVGRFVLVGAIAVRTSGVACLRSPVDFVAVVAVDDDYDCDNADTAAT